MFINIKTYKQLMIKAKIDLKTNKILKQARYWFKLIDLKQSKYYIK